jgi:glucose-1-phosphate thymidylyltransferase
MKGVILAGGTGSRLYPLTKVTNKHLLPVYDEPMICYPLKTLISSGIKDILIVSGRGHVGHFLELLGSGSDLGVRLSYEIQKEAGGIAQALGLAEHFAGGDSVAVILGDNIFENDVKEEIGSFASGARIFLKKVRDPHRFGVADVDERQHQIRSIEEKPAMPKSHYAVTGLYVYDNSVFDVIRTLKPSGRGELEITDVNNHYIASGSMTYSVLGGFWSDAGTFESLLMAGQLARWKKSLDERLQASPPVIMASRT